MAEYTDQFVVYESGSIKKTASGDTLQLTGNLHIGDGAYDLDIKSHDGTNGLKLAGSIVTATAAELNILDGVTATTAELNILAGVTATTTELNYVDGVTSNIQTQLDSKLSSNYTGDVDITGELLVDSYNETFKKVSSVSAVTGYVLSSASYDSKSFSVTSQATNPAGIDFNSDGTKMYVLDSNVDDVFQYSLSTAFDVSTASYDSVSLVTSEDSQMFGLRFKPDGTKLYLGGATNDSIYQYTLSTAFDLSTASYDSVSFSVSSQATNPMNFAWKSDGTSFFLVDFSTDTVYQYTLSTAWDLSTASYASKSFSVTSQEATPRGIDFNSDGTKMFIVGDTADTIFQYSLSIAWDVSTASYDSVSFAVSSQETAPHTFRFVNSGTKLMVLGINNDTVYQYSTATTTYSTTFDCENANVFETVLDGNTTVVFSNPPASGTPVTTSYDIANASYDSKEASVASQEIIPTDLFLKPDGTSAYVIGTNNDTVYQYTLSTANDISTASYASKSFSVTSQETLPQGLYFKSDGTKMYVVGATNDTVYQYSLSTAWDVSTASYDSISFSVASQENNPHGLEFKPDGTAMYVIGFTNDTVYQYTLSTAWDLSTASYASKSFDAGTEMTSPSGMRFNSDGTKMFILDAGNIRNLAQYSLSTAYDVSTASYDSVAYDSDSENTLATSQQGLHFSSDGTKFFTVDRDVDKLYQYSSSSSVLNDSTAYAMSLKVVQDSGASGYTVTWPTSVDWPSATAPTLTATASAVDQFVFYTYDGGTTWYGFTAGQALG